MSKITQVKPAFRMSKETEETLRTLKTLGIRYNIVTPVERRLELSYAFRNEITGKEQVRFVAELDGYGNITEEGDIFKNGTPPTRTRDYVLNADGERV